MEPPLGSRPLPARTRPTTTASTSGRQTTFRTQSPRSIDPESPAEPREGDNLRAAKSYFAPNRNQEV